MLSFTGWPTPTGFLHRVWVYADGRLIWLGQADVLGGANHHLSSIEPRDVKECRHDHRA